MNRIRAGVYDGLRRAADGFACEISNSDEWSIRSDAISAFVIDFGEFIDRARELGASATIDVAVEPDDQRGFFQVLRCDPRVLELLAKHWIALEISVYGVADTGDEGSSCEPI